jgi:HSF-type DNA-binding
MSNNEYSNGHLNSHAEEKMISPSNKGFSTISTQPGSSLSRASVGAMTRQRDEAVNQSEALQSGLPSIANLQHQLMPGTVNDQLFYQSWQGSLIGNAAMEAMNASGFLHPAGVRPIQEASALFEAQQALMRRDFNRNTMISSSIDPILLQHAGFMSSLVSNQHLLQHAGQIEDDSRQRIGPSYGILQHQQQQQHQRNYQFQSHHPHGLVGDYINTQPHPSGKAFSSLATHAPITAAAQRLDQSNTVEASPVVARLQPPTKLTNIMTKKDLHTAAVASGKRGMLEPFPEKLHRLLMEVATAGKDDVISFSHDGKAFVIHKPDKFFHDIVPDYFKQSRLSSFKRQLNLYGFELITGGPSRGGYFHESFLRDKPDLCRQIRRRDIKLSSIPKTGKYESTAPDFYSMPPITSSKQASESLNRRGESEKDERSDG